MTKSVATQLAVFAGLMLIVFGLRAGLSERFLEPTGITENAYSSERGDADESLQRSDVNVLSCGSTWAPFEAAPDADDAESGTSESRLSSFGAERCEALLAGDGWTAALLVVSGVGVWLILLTGTIDRWRGDRRRAEDAEYDRLVEQKRSASEQRRRQLAETTE